MRSLAIKNQEQVFDALVQRGLLMVDVLKQVKAECRRKKQDVSDYLVAKKIVDSEDIIRARADVLGIRYVNLTQQANLHPQTLKLIPQDIAKAHMAVALGLEKDNLVVAMVDADDIQKVDYLQQVLSQYNLSVYMTSEASLTNALRQYEIEIKANDISDKLNIQTKSKSKNSNQSVLARFSDNDIVDAQVLEAASPISQALTSVLHYAVNNRASDVHIEAMEHDVRIRVRIDGVLINIHQLPKSLENALIARIKICAQLKVDEKRLPQDGEFTINVFNQNIDLRVAVSPTIWGEQVIMRILDRSGLKIGLETLGYSGQTLKVIRKALKNSSGMILTSGPTGSGKTTSLYTLLQEIVDDSVKVITLEDPPEYKMNGVNQIPINKNIGLTFSAGLRSVLRQDPDVIMVGEIRDPETAQLAVQASLTGHLVFSTLHTNSAAGILPRLLDMGVEPFLISSTVRVVIGQRLVRKNADENESYKADKNEIDSIRSVLKDILPHKNDDPVKIKEINDRLGYIDLPFIDDDSYTLYRGVLNSKNPHNTFQGRLGLYEAFSVSEKIQELIMQKSSSSVIQRQAQDEGMITMRQDGYLKVLAGITTPSEINRVISAGNI